MSKRIEWIDLAKGWTIFFVVLFHVVGTIHDSNYFKGIPQNISEFIWFLLGIFIMPVFFALSGFLYKKINNWNQFYKMVIKRIIGLGIPYVIFNILYVSMLNLAPSNSIHNSASWHSLLLIGYNTISYLWFLYALVVIELLVGLMDVFKFNLNLKLIISLMIFVISQIISLPKGIHYAFSWLIIFMVGMLIRKFPQLYKNQTNVIFEILLLLIGLTIQLKLSNGSNWFYSNQIVLINFLTKLTIVPIMFWVYSSLPDKNKISGYFKKYGKESLIIYLVHAPTASVFKIVLIKLGVSNYFIMVILLFILSWGLSILACWCTKKFKPIKFIFYPTKFIKLPN